MILVGIIVVLFCGGLLAWLVGRFNPAAPRIIALATVVFDLGIFLNYCWRLDSNAILAPINLAGTSVWITQFASPWIPEFGINFLFAMDGISLTLIALTLFLALVAVLAAWSEIHERAGFFYFNLLWVLAGVLGIFTALDLFLFFFFWEVMLIPMYLLISIWGHEKKEYAALKFFIFTQISGLLMLLSILALVFIHYRQTGHFTFSYFDLLGTPIDPQVSMWIMLGFFVAFMVKLPGVPLHNWLPDAHTQAPTAGSVILAGVLLKTGAYGLLRFIFPLFPQAAAEFAPVAMTLGVISILYGAKLAFAQFDIKRLVAYTSISHMGFILIGIFAWNTLALQGAMLQMLAHGISSAALFALAGGMQHRLHTRDLRQMGGFWTIVPRTGAIAMFFLIAALGLPGLGNFVGESMVLFGAFPRSPVIAICATIGVIFAPVYALRVMQKAFQGEPNKDYNFSDKLTELKPHELLMMSSMILALVVMGIYPQPIIDTLAPAISALHQIASPQMALLLR